MSISLIGRIGDEVDAIDAFAGFGGTSQGLKAAGVRLRAAANHNELSLECYGQNFDDVDLWLADLVDETAPKKIDRRGKEVAGRYVDPAELPRARLAWFSPACFPAGTLVLTKRGLVPIEDVVVGDEAWTHENRWRPVTATMVRRSATVVLAGKGNHYLELTPNHRLWARESSTQGSSLELGERADVPAGEMAGKCWATPAALGDVEFPDVPSTVEWGWLGRWAASGWVEGSTVVIRCVGRQADEVARQLPGQWRLEADRDTVDFVMLDPSTASWLCAHFNASLATRRLPAWVLALPPCDARRFLEGVVSASKGSTFDGPVVCVSVSKEVAHGIRLLAVRLGRDATVRPITERSDLWAVSLEEGRQARLGSTGADAHWWGQVESVRAGRDTTVYNITVDEDHTYVADGIVVHNCTHHSQANAKKVYKRGLQLAMTEDEDWDEQRYVNSERSRATMSCVLRYAAKNHPEIIIVENVVEVSKWGPGRDGSTFRWWLREIDKIGYDVQLCWFNSMFFAPCPQSRDRLYIVAHRKGNRAPTLDYRPTAYCMSDACGGRIVAAVQTWKPKTAAWVTETWGKYLSQYDYRCPHCRAQVHPASWMALSAVDFSIHRPTLAERIERQGPPATNTWERLRRAYAKFYYAPPVVVSQGILALEQIEYRDGATSGALVDVRHSDTTNRNRHISGHLSTLTGKNGVGIALHETKGHPGHTRASGTLPLGVASERRQSILAIMVPNRTNNVSDHATGALSPVMAGTVSQGVVVAAAGNTTERPGQTRARSADEQLFAQSATAEFGLAAMPVLRGTEASHLESGAHAAGQLRTIAAGGSHHSLLTAFTQKINGGPLDTAPHSVADQLRTITAGGMYGIDPTGLFLLPTIDDWRLEATSVTASLAVATALIRQQLCDLPPYEGEITDEMLLQVRWGMLEPDPELRRGMAFAEDYILIGNKGQVTAGLGNAVTPPVAEWITARCLETLG